MLLLAIVFLNGYDSGEEINRAIIKDIVIIIIYLFIKYIFINL